jgi:hypothetical protein
MQKMSDLTKSVGVSRRTFQRWCADGKVPGAYRTEGGHWRFDGDPDIARRQKKSDIAEVLGVSYRTLQRLEIVPCDLVTVRRQLPTGDFITVEGEKWEAVEVAQRCYDATEFAVTAQGISDDDLHSPMVELEQRDPEKAQWLKRPLMGKFPPDAFEGDKHVTEDDDALLVLKPRKLKPNALPEPARLQTRDFDAVELADPTGHVNGLLISKAYRLRLNSRDVTPKSLARELGISVATLYRRYGRDAVKKACDAPVCDGLVPQGPTPAKPKQTRNWQ